MFRLLKSFIDSQNGNASIEFVIWFPMFFTLMCAAINTGIVTVRRASLDIALNSVVRDIRIGVTGNPSHDSVKTAICEKFIGDVTKCERRLHLEMIPLDMGNFTGIPAEVSCVDAGDFSAPEVNFQYGDQENQILFLRACYRYAFVNNRAAGFGGSRLTGDDADGDGNISAYSFMYDKVFNTTAGGALVATSAFVREP